MKEATTMDLRIVKTKRSIRNAFLNLLNQKPLEQITVTELAQQAEINKGTFYLHYHDIYDLAHQLQTEVLQDILNSLPQADELLMDLSKFTVTLFHAFYNHQREIDLLFSGNQSSVLPVRIQEELKGYFYERFPQTKKDPKFNIFLSYSVCGGYYAYLENHKTFGLEQVVQTIGEISRSFDKQWDFYKNKF